VIEAVDPIKIDLISMSDTCKVYDNLHMKWMWIWMCPYNITAALIDQALGSHLEIWVTPGQQMMVKCGDWVCRPNQNWSHINVRHMQGVWQPSYAVDVNMDVSLQHWCRDQLVDHAYRLSSMWLSLCRHTLWVCTLIPFPISSLLFWRGTLKPQLASAH
jgi:hypothetical protein